MSFLFKTQRLSQFDNLVLEAVGGLDQGGRVGEGAAGAAGVEVAAAGRGAAPVVQGVVAQVVVISRIERSAGRGRAGPEPGTPAELVALVAERRLGA